MLPVQWRNVTAVVSVSAVLVAAGIHALPGQDSDEPALRILSPADESLLDSGKVEVVGVRLDKADTPPPELTVDGVARAWEKLRPPVLLARLDLRAGPHQIRVGSTLLRVFVRAGDTAEDAPQDWAAWASHPAVGTSEWKECTQCHETGEEEGITIVGAVREPDACLKCHSPQDFGLIHFHPLDPISACHNCHAIHGSPRPSLLKDEVKPLCGKCHE